MVRRAWLVNAGAGKMDLWGRIGVGSNFVVGSRFLGGMGLSCIGAVGIAEEIG